MQPTVDRLSAFPARPAHTPRKPSGSGAGTSRPWPPPSPLSKDLPSVPRPTRTRSRNTSRPDIHDDHFPRKPSSRDGPRRSPQSTRAPRSTTPGSSRKLRITTPNGPLSASSYTSTSFNTPVKSPLKGTPKTPTRPPSAFARQNSAQSRYMDMLLTLNRIPRLHNILAILFNWLLLAGFIVFPASFTDLPTLTFSFSAAIRRSAPILIAASSLCCTGLIGLLWLSIRWRTHYVWLVNRLYLSSALHGLVGLLGTVASVYAQHNGFWSTPARIAVAFEGTVLVVFVGLFVLCNYMLGKVKVEHEEKVAAESKAGNGLRGLLGRAVTKPPFAPGSIV